MSFSLSAQLSIRSLVRRLLLSIISHEKAKKESSWLCLGSDVPRSQIKSIKLRGQAKTQHLQILYLLQVSCVNCVNVNR